MGFDRTYEEWVLRFIQTNENGIFLHFEYIGGLSEPEKKTFLNIVAKLLLNIDVRFPCPSTSINSRQAQQNIDVVTTTLNRPFIQCQKQMPIVLDCWCLFVPRRVYQRKKDQWVFFVSGNFPEINRILIEIENKQDSIVRPFNSTAIQNERERENKTITLLDVFKVVNHESNTIIWDMTMSALTILLTTVRCEQHFSRLRHKLHENMSKETSFAFLRMSEKRNYYLIDEKQYKTMNGKGQETPVLRI